MLTPLVAFAAMWMVGLRLPFMRSPAAPPAPEASPAAPHEGPSSAAPSGAVSPSPAASHRDPNTFRIAVDERRIALLFLALPKFIADHSNDMAIECIVVPDAAQRWQMLAANRIDAACGTLDSFVLASTRMSPGALLFETATSTGFDALVTTRGESVADLKGKTIAVVSGGGGLRLLAYFLDSAKVLLSEIHFVDVDDPRDAVSLLRLKRVDAAVLWEPFVQTAVTECDAKVIARSSPALSWPTDICVVGYGALSNRRAEVMRFMQHWFELEAALLKDRTLGIEMVARDAQHPASEVASLLEHQHLLTLTDNKKLDPRSVFNEMQTLVDFWHITDLRNTSGPPPRSLERVVQLDLLQAIEIDSPAARPPPVTPEPEMPSPSSAVSPGAASPAASSAPVAPSR